MPIHPALASLVRPKLLTAITAADAGDFSILQARLVRFKSLDVHMRPYVHGERGTSYYKSFAHAIEPKIIPAIAEALTAGTLPEIELSFAELDAARVILGIPKFGSPQDTLYAYSSARYPNWGLTLFGMGFVSACMVGQSMLRFTMAPRLLELGEPDETVDELHGAIASDFWVSKRVVSEESPFRPTLDAVYAHLGKGVPTHPVTKLTVDAVIADLTTDLNSVIMTGLVGLPALRSSLLLRAIRDAEMLTTPTGKARRINALFNSYGSNATDSTQEQIALKYVEQGNFLQKLLGGSRVDHLQSNVKMQGNPLRDSHGEIDSIYRIVTDKCIVLVEAKPKTEISRTQLYQMYETYRLRLPPDWKVLVVAALASDPSPQEKVEGVTKLIDMIQIKFDDAVLGSITESLAAICPERHFRWRIRQPR